MFPKQVALVNDFQRCEVSGSIPSKSDFSFNGLSKSRCHGGAAQRRSSRRRDATTAMEFDANHDDDARIGGTFRLAVSSSTLIISLKTLGLFIQIFIEHAFPDNPP